MSEDSCLTHYTLTNPFVTLCSITKNSHPLCDVPQSMGIWKTQISSSSGESIIQSLGYTAYGLYIQNVCQHSRKCSLTVLVERGLHELANDYINM